MVTNNILLGMKITSMMRLVIQVAVVCVCSILKIEEGQ